MSVATMLNNRVSIFDDTDHAWAMFIRDHKRNIIEHAKIYTITMSLMYAVKFNINKFLRHINADTKLSWIVLLINDLGSEAEFENINDIYIPDRQYIEQLYTQYKTIAATQ